MKKVIRLTESELIKVIRKIVKEQDNDFKDFDDTSFYEHMNTMDIIASKFNKNTTEEELEFMLGELDYEVELAIDSEELPDDLIDELVDYGNILANSLTTRFKKNQK